MQSGGVAASPLSLASIEARGSGRPSAARMSDPLVDTVSPPTPSGDVSAVAIVEGERPGAQEGRGAVPDAGEDVASGAASADGAAAPGRRAFDALLARARERFDAGQCADIERAFATASAAHAGQTRSSGEPYITHPVAVAEIVLDLQLDHVSVVAALLHDVLEDCQSVQRADLVEGFGEEIAHLVDGLSKLTHLESRSKEEAQAESFRKMLLAMVCDIRVILIKLADRLHNMRTIDALRSDKQRRIGRETLEVYAPIASRLGMYALKGELEELGFRACYPMRARVLAASVEQARRQGRGPAVERVVERIEAALAEAGLEATVSGREKHLYSLYTKMLKRQLPFQRAFDLSALRIIVASVDDCYRALGLVHRLYTPIFARFKDYIAVPKENGYRSLHTAVHGDGEGPPIEVQIRTREMDARAESGIVARWSDSRGDEKAAESTRFWLSNLVDMEEEAPDTLEFVENVKFDLFPGEIYVLTPKGRVIQLPRDATPVDFAYAVHSQVGNTCVAAQVDRRLVSLSTPLESGQTVEIICSPQAEPSPMWLNSVVTGKARSAIRQHLRDLDRSKAAAFGKRLLGRALARYARTLDDIDERALHSLVAEFRFGDVEELYVDIGLGLRLPSQMAERLIAKEAGEVAPAPHAESAPVLVSHDRDATLHLARCCRPIPGDALRGLFDAGRGIAVHRAGCRNVRRFRRKPRQQIAVDWAPSTSGAFETVVVAQLANQPGALARVTSTLSQLGVNIENMEFLRRGDDDIAIRFVLAVKDRVHLARIVRRLRNLVCVRGVRRES